MNLRMMLCIFVALLWLQTVNAQDSDIKITPSGFVYYQIGQIVKSTDPIGNLTGQPDKSWDQHINFRLGMDAIVQQRLRIVAGVEFGLATFGKGAGGGNQFTTGFSPKEAQGIYTFGDNPLSANPPLQIAVGYFPFKYNPQAMNMGEYLFSYRTGAYTPYIINDFDNCKSRLLGFRVSSTLLGGLRQDLLFTNEMNIGGDKGNTPVGDFSLSYLVDYKKVKFIDVGAGICFNRLLSLSPDLTTPKENPALDASRNIVMEDGDTLFLTLKSIKLMTHVTIDPKQFMEPMSFFGAEDGKIYSEIAILGLKNYGADYKDVLQRIPVLVGLNIPAFKLLDVLSLELEYFGYSGNTMITKGSPKPTNDPDEFSYQQMFHWSLFAQKTLVKGLSVRGVVGKDHFRTVDAGGSPTYEEILRGTDNWHYNLRVMYQF